MTAILNLAVILLHLLICYAMTVSANSRVCCAVAAVLAGVGVSALEHVAVALNAVSIALGHFDFALVHVAVGGRPCEVITTHLDVVVCKLAELIVIHAQQLGLVRAAQFETWNEVDGVGDDGADHKRPCRHHGNVCDLLSELDPIAVNPTTSKGTRADTVEANDVGCGKDTVEEETDHAGDTVLGEDIHGIVNLDPVLDLGGEIADDSRRDTEHDGCPERDETRGRGGSDESGNGTRAPADHGPLASEAPVEEHPGHGAEHGGDGTVPACVDGTEVGAKGRATVESEPAEPEEDGAESDERDVVGTEVEHHLLLASTENHGVGKCRHTRGNFDGTTSGVVEHSPLEGPSVGIPHPVGNRAVHDGGPAEDENHCRHDAAALGDGTHDNGSGNGGELQLVEGVQQIGNQDTALRRVAQGVHETELFQVTNEWVVGGVSAESERVAPKVPLKGHDGV